MRFHPNQENNLSNKQKKNSLRAETVVKENRDGVLKVRASTDGRKQRLWCDNQQKSSPIAHVDYFGEL